MTIRVIGAGVGRTGTTSLKLALERVLGGPCYHMHEVIQRGQEHVQLWHQAIDGGSPNWDAIYGSYVATVDWPGAAFWEQLSEAYPDALVLLSVRSSSDAWFASFAPAVGELMARRPTAEMREWHAMATKLLRTRFASSPFERHAAMAAYEEHNAQVRAAIPADRLVEWQPGDGWAPLCDRLGVPQPDEQFPHLNTGDEFQAMLDGLEAERAAQPLARRIRQLISRSRSRLAFGS
jgi:hypothetical protein